MANLPLTPAPCHGRHLADHRPTTAALTYTVSLFGHARDNAPKERAFTWQEFTSQLGPHYPQPCSDPWDVGALDADKRRLPMFSPATFDGTRASRNVIHVSMGVADLDDILPEQLHETLSTLQSLGLSYLLYTSWKQHLAHTRNQYRARVVIPLNRPVSVLEWPNWWPRFATLFPHGLDKQCKDASRPYFGAFYPEGTDPSVHAYFTHNGKTLDVDAILQLPFQSKELYAPPNRVTKVSIDTIKRAAQAMARSSNPHLNDLGNRLLLVTKGEPFADPGERDVIIYKLCQELAKRFNTFDVLSIAPHFGPSLALMAQVGTDCPTVDDVQYKLERAIAKLDDEQASAEYKAANRAKIRLRQFWAEHGQPGRDTPYTENELETIQRLANVDRSILNTRWLLVNGRTTAFLTSEGYSPLTRDLASTAALSVRLAPAESAGVLLERVNQDGSISKKGLTELVTDYGTHFDSLCYDMTTDTAHFDIANSRLVYPAAKQTKDLVPEYSPDLDQFLAFLAPEDYHQLQIWLAEAPKLDRPLAALALIGPKHTGKSLFAYMLSQLWTNTGPVQLESVFDWNDQLIECPLLLADEKLPTNFRGQARTGEIRDMIQARLRPLKRKYMPESTIKGCIRIIIAANSMSVFQFDSEDISMHDIAAIAERFFFVRVNEQAQDYLKHVGQNRIDQWVNTHALAKHALYLSEHLQHSRKGRFGVEANQEYLTRTLSAGAGMRSAICEFLVKYLLHPNAVDSTQEYLIRVHNGRLLATSKGIEKYWAMYKPNANVPSVTRIGRTLSALSLDIRAKEKRPNAVPINYRVVDLPNLIAWCELSGYCDPEDVLEALKHDTEARQSYASYVQ